MEDRRNIIIAVLLIGIILFGWPYITGHFFPNNEAASAPVATTDEAAPPANPDVVVPTSAAGQRNLQTALSDGPRIQVDTPKLDGSISLTGARIDDMMLKKYRVGLAKDSPEVRLLAPPGTKDAYFSRFGWLGEGIELPNDKTVWQASGPRLTPETPVTLSWRNGTGQIFQLALSIDDNYLITVDQKVANQGGGPVAVRPYGLISRRGGSPDKSTWTIHVGPMGVFDGAADYDWNYDDVEDAGPKGAQFETTGGWLGFTDKYWLTALVPDQKSPIDAAFRASGDVYQDEMLRKTPSVIQPGKQITQRSYFFVGAKETDVLDAYQDKLGFEKFSLAIDWGWFRPIEKMFLYILTWLYDLTGNFGVAIICLTLIVRGLMFPIAQKQFKSMAQMKAIQPKMKKLQEKHKEDKQKQQQELMKLYKEEKVNPLAGCLPMFLQIPVFFALYKLLMLSIEMRHQPFALWIQDLSAPDPLTPVNLFGLLPFDPPGMLHIGLLPILLGVTMFFQFRMQPMTDPVQKQMFAIMPWVMMVFMAPFAAGLQLYWVASNLFTIAQQRLLYARHPELKEQMKRDAEEKQREREAKKASN